MSKRFSFSGLQILALAVLSLFLGVGTANAQKKYGPGVTDTEIKIGQAAPYSGPASAYGAIAKVIVAYMHKVNDEGGINGRKVNIISLDDGFSPPKTVEVIRKLVESEQVLFVHTIGSPATAAVRNYVNARKVPQIFVSSGATMWGDYKNFPYTMGFNATYRAEGVAFANFLLKEKPNAKVAVLYQNDDFGKDVLVNFKAGLGAKAKTMIVAELSYELTDPTVDSQLVTLKGSGADTFLNLTTPKFAAQSIRKVSEMGWKPLQLLPSVSASVGSVLKPAGLDKAEGIVTTAYMKDPTDVQWANDPGLNEWRAFMKKYYPDGALSDWINVYAQAMAQAMVQTLKQCGDDLTRENVMRQAANLKQVELPGLLPGIRLDTGPNDYYPIEQLRLARFNGKQWVLFGDLLSGK